VGLRAICELCKNSPQKIKTSRGENHQSTGSKGDQRGSNVNVRKLDKLISGETEQKGGRIEQDRPVPKKEKKRNGRKRRWPKKKKENEELFKARRRRMKRQNEEILNDHTIAGNGPNPRDHHPNNQWKQKAPPTLDAPNGAGHGRRN